MMPWSMKGQYGLCDQEPFKGHAGRGLFISGKTYGHCSPSAYGVHSKDVNKIGSQVIREIILPALEREVNKAKISPL